MITDIYKATGFDTENSADYIIVRIKHIYSTIKYDEIEVGIKADFDLMFYSSDEVKEIVDQTVEARDFIYYALPTPMDVAKARYESNR